MDSGTMSLWFSNYANLATKALRPRLAARFQSIAAYLEQDAIDRCAGADAGELLKTAEGFIVECASTAYPRLQKSAGANRGALRAFTWGSKVATILKSVAGRVSSKGDSLLKEGQAFFVCDACGFMFVGDAAPEICPVCKAPVARFVRY